VKNFEIGAYAAVMERRLMPEIKRRGEVESRDAERRGEERRRGVIAVGLTFTWSSGTMPLLRADAFHRNPCSSL